MKRRLGSIAFALVVLAVACGDDDDKGHGTVTTLEAGVQDTGTSPPIVDAGTDAGTDASEPDAAPDGTAPPPGPTLAVGDRAGRAYVSLLLVGAADRIAYNASAVDETPATMFGGDFQDALSLLDSLDGVDDWGGGNGDAGADDAGVYPHPLVNPWVEIDALLVDPNLPFSPDGYLELEANPGAHTTCGGRWPGDDALDKTLSFLVNKTRDGVRDGVDAPSRPVSMQFPYLAEPF